MKTCVPFPRLSHSDNNIACCDYGRQCLGTCLCVMTITEMKPLFPFFAFMEYETFQVTSLADHLHQPLFSRNETQDYGDRFTLIATGNYDSVNIHIGYVMQNNHTGRISSITDSGTVSESLCCAKGSLGAIPKGKTFKVNS